MTTSILRHSYLDKAIEMCLVLMSCSGCIMLISTCNLLKNTSSELDKSRASSSSATQLKSVEQKNLRSISNSVVFYHDSSDLDYSIRIWPKGEFSFSPTGGFSGEAEKVLMKGKGRRGLTLASEASREEQYRGQIESMLKTAEKKVSDQKLKATHNAPSWKWIIAGLALAGFAGCYIYTKVKLFFNQ